MIGFTVADVERQTDFFTKVLQFEKISDFRVVGGEYDQMQGVFNTNMRIVHLKLGEQTVELTQYVSPPTGRPIPVPSYSNDEWFQHLAIVVERHGCCVQGPAGQQCAAGFGPSDHHSRSRIPGLPASRRSSSAIPKVMTSS